MGLIYLSDLLGNLFGKYNYIFVVDYFLFIKYSWKQVSNKAQLLMMIIRNVFEQKIIIRMISEGSCDTEDWSNDT